MWMVVRIPAGDITNLHYNFVVAKPLVTIKLRGGTKYLVDNNDCSFYAPELIFRDTPLIFCMNIPNNAR